MNQLPQVCTSILIGLLCFLSTFQANATHIPTSVTNLFKVDKANIGTGDFVEGAVFLTINKEALAKIRRNNKDNFKLVIPFENDTKLTLELEKKSFTTSDFKITVVENGTLSTLDYNPAVFYSGAVKGQSNALVALNFFEDKVTGVVAFQGQNYNVGPYERGGEDSFVIYREQNLNVPNPFECSTEDPVDFQIEPTSSSRSSENKKVRLYVECDHHLYKNLGSNVARVTDFATGLFNIVSTLYQKEDVQLEVSGIKIWSTADPYPNASAKQARNAFASTLNGDFDGDIAHLLSNYKVNGTPPNGGSANIDVLCDKGLAVSYTNITTSYLNYPTFSWSAYAVTHEIGHNLGSPHTHSCLWPTGPIDNCWCPEGGCTQGPEPTSSGTMMSYCHLDPGWTNSCSLSSDNPGISFSAGFGRQPGDLIRKRIANASCLSTHTPVVISLRAATSVRNETCFGEKDGSISLNLSNGISPYTYKWSTGARTARLTNLAGGTYEVTVTDRNGSSVEISASVRSANRIDVDAGADKTIACTNGSVVLEAANTTTRIGFSYKWTKIGGNYNAAGTSTTVTESGTYVYAVSNQSTGCTARDTVVVKQDQAPVFEIRGNDIDCNTPFAELKINTNLSNLTYKWTGPNGFTSSLSSPKVDQAGVYFLSVTNAYNCVSQDQITIRSDFHQPDVQAYGGVITCSKNNIDLLAESNEVVSYKWTGPNDFISTSKNPTTEIPGIYTLEVTALNGCTNTTTAQVGAATDLPTVRITGGSIACNESFTTLSAISDANNISYQWTGPNDFRSTNGQIQANITGVYTLVVSNGSGCTNSTSYTLNQNVAPDFDIQASPLSCQNSATTLTLSNYDNVLSYQWTGPNNYQSNAPTPTINEGGIYTLVVTSIDGCSTTKSYTVNHIVTPSAIDITAAPITCANNTTQLITSSNSVFQGYDWMGPNNFRSSEPAPVVSEIGNYTLVATTAAGCVVESSLTVEANNDRIEILALSATKLNCTQTSAQLNIQTNKSNTQYLWKGPNNFQSTEQNPTVTFPGIYEIYLLGENGCTNNSRVEVIMKSINVDNIFVIHDDCGQNEGRIKIDVAGPEAAYSVQWNTGQTGFEITNLAAGIYSAVIQDQYGCTFNVYSEITTNEPILLNELDLKEITCSGAADGHIKVSVTGGLAPYQYIWSNGETGDAIYDLDEGTHTLEVVDARNCVKTFYFDILDPEYLEVTTELDDSSVDFFVEGGKEEYTYEWSNGLSGSSESDLEDGDYEVTISDASGCVVVEEFTIESLDITENISADYVTVDQSAKTMASPNPANNYFNLNYEFEESTLVFISIFNAQGYYLYRTTMERKIIDETFNTTSWENGTYYIQVLSKNGFMTEELKIVHN